MKLLRATAGIVATVLAITAPLAAQTADRVGRDTADTIDTIVLAPVVVTATRRAADLFAAPVAVSSVRKGDMFGRRGYGLDDALALVPGVLAQSRSGAGDVRLVIRGYGARGAGDRSNAGTSRGVRVLLDGFPETEPDGRTSFDGIDLAATHAIEVIRSNASTLWGNAAGGVVSLSTVPDYERSYLSLESAAGSFGLRRAALIGGTALGQGRLTATLTRTTFDGWRRHSGSERSLVNLSLATPIGRHTRLGVYALGTDNLFRIPGPLTVAQVADDPAQANTTYAQRDERRDNLVGRLGVRLEHDFTNRMNVGGALYLNPKHLERSERGTFRDFHRYHVGGNTMLQAATPLGRSVLGTLIVGSDFAYQDGPIRFYTLTAQGARGDTLRTDKREGALNFGLFAQEEIALSNHWRVLLGARYDDISYYYRDLLGTVPNGEKAFRGVIPKLGLTWRRTPRHSVYASVGGGIEAPAGNETDPADTFGEDTVTAINPQLDAIRSTTYELGTRQALAFGSGMLVALSYDVALYHTDVRNEIVPYRGGRFYFTAGSARRRGAELGVTLSARGGLSLQGAAAYQDHRYRRYVVDSIHYGRPGSVADFSGNHVVGVPEHTYAASLSWTPPALSWFGIRAGVQGASAYFCDDANQVRVPAYTITTVTLATATPLALGRVVAVRGFITVHNLFDQTYISSAFLNPDEVGGQPIAFEPGLPRNVVIGLTLEQRPAPRPVSHALPRGTTQGRTRKV